MTYRDDWNNATPLTRSFYSNFARRYSDLCGWFWYEPWLMTTLFEIPAMWSPYPRSPYNLFKINMSLQDYWWGRHDADVVYWADGDTFYGPYPSLPADTIYAFPVEDQMEIVPNDATNYPAARVNTRRSYWTGVSRKRRNL